MAEQTTTTTATEICEALKLFATGALSLAAALEGAQKIGIVTQPAPDPSPDPAPALPPASFRTGLALVGSSVAKRESARLHAADAGRDLETWSRAVRRLRTEVIGCTAEQFGAMLDLSPGCVHNWESGLAFATSANRDKLAALAAGVAGWQRGEWCGNGEVTA